MENAVLKEDILPKLRELGLTGYAAKAFVAIVQGSPISATDLCGLTQIPDSKIYHTLKDLEAKGLIITQHGTPSLYKPSSYTNFLSPLKENVRDDYCRKIGLISELEEAFQSLADRKGRRALEIAYVTRGIRNIIDKMAELTRESRTEVVALISDEGILSGVRTDLARAGSHARVKLAVAKTIAKYAAGTNARVKEHYCKCNFLISDSKKLITISGTNPENYYAIITEDQAMIMMSKEHYDNPRCCMP